MTTITTDLPSTVEETLAACPQCVSLHCSPLDLAQFSDVPDFGYSWSGMLDMLNLCTCDQSTHYFPQAGVGKSSLVSSVFNISLMVRSSP
jgi:hypothetical protein